MAKKSNLLGAWAFFIGVVLAIIVGVLSGLEVVSLGDTVVLSVLSAVGVIVGLFNVTGGEKTPFLLSGISLIIASVFGMSLMALVPALAGILAALLAIFVPATIVVAVKNVFGLAKN
ncbi:hypothetical protein FJZ17_03520 [Candidatus Pacearchaeota archaeon]|nr:hypothetical protein [Candidatus Pacearchaeota archaeon]